MSDVPFARSVLEDPPLRPWPWPRPTFCGCEDDTLTRFEFVAGMGGFTLLVPISWPLHQCVVDANIYA